MWPTLLTIGNFHLTAFAIVVVLACIWTSFLMWRHMRLDYEEQKILSLTAVLFTVSAIVGVTIHILTYKFVGLVGVATLTAALIVLRLRTRREGWDFWEWLDLLGPAGLGIATVANLAWGPDKLFDAGVWGVGWLLTKWVKAVYRKFKWYKSGRVGFVGLFAILWFSLGEIAVAMWHKDHLYWGGLTVEQWLAAWVTTACVVTIYLRSGRRLSQEFSFLKRKPRKK